MRIINKNFWNIIILWAALSAGFSGSAFSADVSPPTLVSWSRSPATVNTTNGSAQVTVQMRILDDESGADFPNVTARHPSGQSTGFAAISLVAGVFTPNGTDATYEATLNVPQGSAPGLWEITLFPLVDLQGNRGPGFGPGPGYENTFTVTEDPIIPTEDVFKISLGEPITGETHSGIGNLRGWAISNNGIDRVEIFIDGKYMYDAPYGGLRVDVEAAFPNVDGSLLSGYSLAFGYADLGSGQHTVRAVAYDSLGNSTEQSSTFNVVVYEQNFINSNEVVDLSSSTISASGDEIMINDASIGQRSYNLKLKWRTAEQGFEVIEIQ
jgi:hypothetical protein